MSLAHTYTYTYILLINTTITTTTTTTVYLQQSNMTIVTDYIQQQHGICSQKQSTERTN